MRHLTLGLVICAGLGLLVGCTGDDGGARSPEDAYEQLSKASEAKDWKTVYSLMDPDSGDLMLFATIMAAGFSTIGDEEAGKELEELGKKHGIKEKKEEDDEGERVNLGDKEAMKKAAKDMFADVKDKPALFADVMTFLDKRKDEGETEAGLGFAKGELADLEVKGDKATAKVKTGDEEKDIAFVKRDGRWYVQVPM